MVYEYPVIVFVDPVTREEVAFAKEVDGVHVQADFDALIADRNIPFLIEYLQQFVTPEPPTDRPEL